MPDLKFLLKVSRPRFWFYIFGPYILGLLAGVATRGELSNGIYILLAIYFLYPANLLIYGVNDIFDYETDKLNPKKTDYESFVTPERRSGLWLAIFLAAENTSLHPPETFSTWQSLAPGCSYM